jgi:hypothetical protein
VPNRLRILYDNLADTALTLTASSTASSSLDVSNLLTNYKSEVWRATGKTSETITQTWSTLQTFNMAKLSWANFSSAATMAVEVFTNAGDSVPVLNTGDVPCCAYQPFGVWDWGMLPLGVNAFSYGGSVTGRVYFTATLGRKVRITVKDPLNTAAYVEAGRLAVGAYWSPEINANWGPQLDVNYNTAHRRTDAGDLRTERRPQHRALRLELGWLKTEADRARMYDILVGNGMARPFFLSLFPEDDNPSREQSHQMWCKLSNNGAMSAPKYGVFSAPLVVEEV